MVVGSKDTSCPIGRDLQVTHCFEPLYDTLGLAADGASTCPRSPHHLPIAPTLLAQRFPAPMLNRIWRTILCKSRRVKARLGTF